MVDKSTPAFYLGSTELSGDFARARACRIRDRLRGPDAREYLWVRVSPPVIGQPFGLGGRDIEDLVLAPRYMGAVLSPPSEHPLAVQIYIARNDSILRAGQFTAGDVEMVAWGEVYQSEALAAKAGRG